MNFRAIFDACAEVWFESNWLIRGAAIVIAGAALVSLAVAAVEAF
jgi:hypothetical protein